VIGTFAEWVGAERAAGGGGGCAAKRIVVEYRQEDRATVSRDVLLINPDLVWDYEIPEDGSQDEAFQRWYIARVLTRGRMEDVQDLGLHTIHAYLPDLVLPTRVRRFWEWYLSLPDVRVRYGPADSPAA
jgi:hypothetical protein